MDGANDSGAGFDVPPRSRRRRAEEDVGGLSVAELLARHGLASAGGSASGTRHRLDEPAEWDDAETGEFLAAEAPGVGPGEFGASARSDVSERVGAAPPPAFDGPPAWESRSGGGAPAEHNGSPVFEGRLAGAEPGEREGSRGSGASAARSGGGPASHERDEPPADDDQVGFELRARRIDETLTRLTAIHAGLGVEMTERVSRSGRFPPVPERHGAPRPGSGGDQPVSPRRSGWSRAVRVLGVVVATVLFVATGAGWGIQTWLGQQLRPVAALDPNANTVIDPVAQAGDQNYLVVGAAGTGAAGTGTASPVSTVLLVHVPAKQDRVVVAALPTDLTVDRPSCDRWDAASASYPGGTSPEQTGVPLAASYAVGGPRCLTKTVQLLTGIAVNHYVGMDLTGLAPMVDAVHGVGVCGATGGAPAHVTGASVIDFLGLDRGDTQRQELFLVALLAKATSDQVLAHLGQLRAFVAAFAAHSRVDHASLPELATLAASLRDADPAKVFLVTVPTSADAAKTLFDAVRVDGPLPGGGAAATALAATAPAASATDDGPSGAGAQPPPSAVTVNVRNVSNRTGLANQVADSLRTLGFTVAAVSDAAHSTDRRTVIRHSVDEAAQAATLASAVPGAVSEAVPGAGILDLVLGDSFDGQVRAAPVAAGADQPTAAGQLRTLAALTGSCR